MFKKSLFVSLSSLVLVVSMLLAACAPAPTAAPATAPAATPQVIIQKEVVTATPEPTTPPEPVEITYYTFSAAPDHLKDLDQMIQSFETKYPLIKVKVETAPFADYFTKLQTLIAGGTAPDVFELNYENFVTYADKGLLLDLSPMLEADSTIDPAIYYPRALQAFN